MEQPVQQQVTATRDCPQQIQAQHGPPLDSIPYEDPSSSRQGGQGSARTSLSRASTSSNKSPKAADALPAVHPAGFASEQQRELNLPSILTKASKKKDKQTVGLPPRSISTSSPLTSALRLRRGTRDLGENFQMHMLLGALEGIELDRLDTVQGSTLLEPVSSPKRGEGSPTTRNSVRMQDAFERAKLQADKELVNFRRETTCLLKQHEGEKDQAILHSILSIVGQCLGMTDTDFQETVLRMVDEAEAVRAACTTQQIRVHAANLLFILTRCSRLIVTEDKSLFEKPCYLTVAKTQPRMPRRLSGELESSMTASKESDDGSIYRSRTMPAKALNMMVQRIPSERSPPQSKPPSSLVIRPSDKHSVKGMLGGTKSKKSRRKRGAAWFRAALKPGPSRLGRPSTDDELRSDLQAEMGSPESYEETASAKGTKGFLKSFTARLKDSFTGKSGKGKAEERSGTAEMWQSGSAKSPAKGQLSRVSFNEEREVKNFQAFTSQLEDDHCAANFPSPYPSPGFSASGAASRSGGPAAHSPMRPFDRAAKQPETRIEAISEIGSVQAVSTTESPPLRSAKSSPGPHQRTYYLSSPGSSNAESSAYSEKRSWRSFKLSFYGNKDNASPGPEPVRRSRSAASRDSELADPHALAMDVAAAARALESPSVGDSASPELHTRSRAVLASPRPGDLASLSSWDSSAFRNSLAAEDLEDATSTDSSSTLDYVICRICEDRVPSIILQEHNTVCTKIESSDIRIKSLASQPSVDARLTKLANYLEAMPHSHDPYILRVAHWARSAAALQPDNTGVPINRCQTCYKALEMMLHQGTMEGTMSVDVDALGRRVKSQIHAKVAELELAMSSIATGSPCSTPHSPHISMSINDFEIIKPISRGAFGRVYLARKKATQDLFAIKVMRKHDLLRKNMVESVKNERNILATTSNPFVVRFYYSFQSPTNLYIVMEYVSGGDCFSLLRNMGCLSEDDARVYVAETVLALEYCHAQGIVHRDLKPDNLLISDQGRIKLTDFGLSVVGVVDRATDYGGKSTAAAESSMENIRSLEHSVFSEASEGSDGTSMGSGNPAIASTSAKVVLSKEDHRRAVGTPDYLAPELLLGIGHTPAVDWWSLGAILFEFVVGIPPFNADSPQAIFQNILDLDIDWPDESNLKEDERMSPECRDLISKLLVRNPEERLGSRGATDIKLHPWFKSIDWSSLTHQKAAGTAPFIPEFENELDTSYFCAKPVSQHSLANDIFTENSTRFSEGSDDCSASPIKNRADSRRESRRSNLGRSHSKRHSPGSFRDGLDATLDLEPGLGNNPEASTNSIPSEVMGCGSTTEGSLATADTMSFSSAESEQEYLNRMASVRELTVPGEDYSGHECLTSPTSGPSWDNFSYKNLDNLAESNLSLHDALVRSGSVSGPNTGRFLGGLSREYSDPNFAPHLRDLNGSRDSRDG